MTICRGSAFRGGFWHLRVAQDGSESDVESPSARPMSGQGSIAVALLAMLILRQLPYKMMDTRDFIDLAISQITHVSRLYFPGTVTFLHYYGERRVKP